MAKIDVLLPVYNPDLRWMVDALRSLEGQTFTDWRCVIVVDGPLKSEDQKKFFKDLKASRPDRYEIIHLSENLGVGGALHEGVKHCNADYIARMDADDLMHVDRLKDQYERMEGDKGIDVLSCSLQFFQEGPDQIRSFGQVIKHPEKITKEVAKSSLWFMNHPTVMFRRSSLVEAGSYDPSLRGFSEDYELWIRMIRKGYRLENMNDKVYLLLRLSRESATKSFNQKNHQFLLDQQATL